MTRISLILAPLALAGAAYAADLPVVEDTDGNGTWSLAELQTVWTGMNEDGYAAVDANADGAVDATELQAAWDNGILLTPEN